MHLALPTGTQTVSPGMASEGGSKDVITMVCVTCGAEQFFDEARVPASLVCKTCRSTVFRAFSTPTVGDDTTVSRLEDQARSIAYGDPSPQTAEDDVRDLEGG